MGRGLLTRRGGGGTIDILWTAEMGTISFFTEENSYFDDGPHISASKNTYFPTQVYSFEVDRGYTAIVSFPVDFTKYKYYGVIVNAYSSSTEYVTIECGSYNKTYKTDEKCMPCTHILNAENTGITSGKCYFKKTSNQTTSWGEIYKVFATNSDISYLIL